MRIYGRRSLCRGWLGILGQASIVFLSRLVCVVSCLCRAISGLRGVVPEPPGVVYKPLGAEDGLLGVEDGLLGIEDDESM